MRGPLMHGPLARGRRRSTARSAWILSVVVLLVVTTVSCGDDRAATQPLTVWTVLTGEEDMQAQRRIVAAYERENPGEDVQLVAKPETGDTTGDATTLITAVRGGTAPDVSVLGRFAISQYASIGLVSSLRPLIEASDPGITNNYVPFSVEEGMYEGELYALPFDFDVRGLFYNKAILRESGVDPAVLDPAAGPPTIDEVKAIAKKITRTDGAGNYRRMGFIPWSGEGNHATWGLLNGARYFDPDSCEVTPQEPALRRAFTQLRRQAKELNYNRVSAFLGTYQPAGQPPSQSPFYTGHLGMSIDGNWQLSSLRKYAPKLDYGVTYLPVENKGDPPFTWSGGFGLVVPSGAPAPERSWKFMRFMAGPKGQAIYAKALDKLPTWKKLLDRRDIVGNQGLFASLVDETVARPSIPVGALLSSTMDTAQEAAVSGAKTPREALGEVGDRVNPQMRQFCPYHLPKADAASR